MAPKNKPKFEPGFQSPAVGGFTPAFQSIEGLTPKSGTGSLTPVAGTGEVTPTAPAQPPLKGTFTDVKTGRPSGIATGSGTFFGLNEADIALIQAGEARKGVSGSEGMGTIAEAAQARELQQGQQQAAQTTGQARQIPFQTGPSGILGFALRDLGNVRLMKQAKEGNMGAAAALGLNAMDIQTLQSGKAEINAFSQFVEAIPIVGKLRIRGAGISIGVSDFTGKSPTGKVDELLKLMKQNVDNASDYATIGAGNPALADFYKDDIKEIEQTILALESQIKLLSIQSPAIQSEPENADLLMGEIQNHKNTLTTAKLKLGII